MKLFRLCTVAAVPFLMMSCCGRPVEGGNLGAGAQEILDALSVEGELAFLALDQLKVADDQPTAEGVAQALAEQINATRVGCATATLDPRIATELSIFVSCSFGDDPERLTLDGAVRVAVSIEDQLVSFHNSATGLRINGTITNDTTTITADLASGLNSFSRVVSFALDRERFALDADGTFTFDPVGNTLNITASYAVSKGDTTHTHDWSSVVLLEGFRFPSLGIITIADAPGDPLTAVVSNLDNELNIGVTQDTEAKEFRVKFNEAQPQLFDGCSPVETSGTASRRARSNPLLSVGCILPK